MKKLLLTIVAALLSVLTYSRAFPVVSVQPSNILCAGTVATFTATDYGFNLSQQWQYSADSGVTYNNIPGATDTAYTFAVSAWQNGYYFRIIFATNFGFDTTSALQLTVNGPATDSIATSICTGDSFVVNGTAFYTAGTYNDTIAGASAHGCDSIVVLQLAVYAPSFDSISASICSGDSVVINGTAFYTAGTYNDTIAGASAHGCDSIVVLKLAVYAPSFDSISASICSGDSVVINGRAFYNAGTFNDTIAGASAHGCDSIVVLQLAVTPSVTPLVNIASLNTGDTICQNTIVTLFATGINGGNNADYQWQRNGVNVGNSATYIANPVLNGDVFTCILTGTATCATKLKDTSAAVTFTVVPYPAVAVTPSRPEVCAGDTVTLTATGGSTYLWNTGDSVAVIYTTGGTYTVTATNSYGCTAGSTPFTMRVAATATDTLYQKGDTLVSGPSLFYQWYFNDSIIAGAISGHYVPVHTGNYSVAVIDSFGCITYSPVIYILQAGIANVPAAQVNLYPNPNNGTFTLTLPDATLHSITITDALGRTVLNNEVQTTAPAFNLSGLPAGVYTLNVTGTGAGTIRFSIVQ